MASAARSKKTRDERPRDGRPADGRPTDRPKTREERFLPKETQEGIIKTIVRQQEFDAMLNDTLRKRLEQGPGPLEQEAFDFKDIVWNPDLAAMALRRLRTRATHTESFAFMASNSEPENPPWAAMSTLVAAASSSFLNPETEPVINKPSPLNNSTNKYHCLIATFWGKNDDSVFIKNIHTVFNDPHFDIVIFVHKGGIEQFSEHPLWGHPRTVWINSTGEWKWATAKRYLFEEIVGAYDYLWMIDEDALFDPNAAMGLPDVMARGNLHVGQPGRKKGRTHWVTWWDPEGSHVYRLTNFVECGPLTVHSARSWNCLWRAMHPRAGTGWGLDQLWCVWLPLNCGIPNPCAIIDRFWLVHASKGVASAKDGYKDYTIYTKYRDWVLVPPNRLVTTVQYVYEKDLNNNLTTPLPPPLLEWNNRHYGYQRQIPTDLNTTWIGIVKSEPEVREIRRRPGNMWDSRDPLIWPPIIALVLLGLAFLLFFVRRLSRRKV